ncbi:MAG: hypothetical protein IJV64_06455 [Oscillospiraceae bacterium]|nr:hypothetical protein [Oscillospiraceae bacterium]
MENRDNRREEIQGEINALKQLLTNTDYQAIKHSEGEMSEEEFAPIREKRQGWRERINELQKELDADDGE